MGSHTHTIYVQHSVVYTPRPIGITYSHYIRPAQCGVYTTSDLDHILTLYTSSTVWCIRHVRLGSHTHTIYVQHSVVYTPRPIGITYSHHIRPAQCGVYTTFDWDHILTLYTSSTVWCIHHVRLGSHTHTIYVQHSVMYTPRSIGDRPYVQHSVVYTPRSTCEFCSLGFASSTCRDVSVQCMVDVQVFNAWWMFMCSMHGGCSSVQCIVDVQVFNA